MVPGPDGLLGYGGKCFPKDISAFAEFNSNSDLGKLLRLVIDINNSIRNL